MGAVRGRDVSFRFGRNWKSFVTGLTEADVEQAARDLERLTGPLKDRTFLDVGCGSGLSSAAALRLGARRVDAFDLDPLCVECAEAVLKRFAPAGAAWGLQQGSVLDSAFLAARPSAEVVYSWGVLHHTGRMWDAVAAAAGKVGPGGVFALALYNRMWSSGAWRAVKAACHPLPMPVQAVPAFCLCLPRALWRAVTLRHPLRDRRGMSVWHDAVDWIGGHPYEYASAGEVEAFLAARGFRLERVFPTRRTGCNEFAFRQGSEPVSS